MPANKKVLLIQTPPWGVTTFPLGIAYLSEFLHSKGIPASVYDLNIELYNQSAEAIKERWNTNEFEFWSQGTVLNENVFDIGAIVAKICTFEADVIAFSTTFASIPFCNAVLDELRKKNVQSMFVVGGAGPSYDIHRAFFRRDIVDYFILGEGELVLAELIIQIAQGESTYLKSQCEIWKDNDDDRAQCIRAKKAYDIAAIPFPTFEGFDPSAYAEKDLLPIITSRGCMNACHFCCDWRLKAPFRSRDPQSILKEIVFLVERYDRKRFEFSDLLINGDIKKLSKLCDLLIKENCAIAWGGQAAVRKEMKSPLYKKMKRAGCGSLTFGFESFSDPLLVKMNKRFRARDARYAIKSAKKAGMLVEANLLVGFPGEEEEDIDNTIRFIKKHRKYIDRINSLNICSVGPGMTIWERSLKFKIYKDEIDDWYAWHTADRSNTLSIREKRHARLKEFIQSEKLGLGWQNLKKE